MFFWRPSKPTSGAEWTVIVVGFATLLILAGLVGFGLRLFATPTRPEVAAQLVLYSSRALGLGVLIWIGYWLFRRLTD